MGEAGCSEERTARCSARKARSRRSVFAPKITPNGHSLAQFRCRRPRNTPKMLQELHLEGRCIAFACIASAWSKGGEEQACLPRSERFTVERSWALFAPAEPPSELSRVLFDRNATLYIVGPISE